MTAALRIVTDEPEHLEAHIDRARTDGVYVVDRWGVDDWNCTCYAAMVLGKRCDHIARVQQAVAS